jgi:hypothetical protein
VLTAHGYLRRRAGDVLTRPWLFTTVCHKGTGCRTSFLRMTDIGPSRTFLVAHHGYFTAKFPVLRDRCLDSNYPSGLAPGKPGRMQSVYRLWWSSDRRTLLARERSASHDRCTPQASRTFWTAVSNSAG